MRYGRDRYKIIHIRGHHQTNLLKVQHAKKQIKTCEFIPLQITTRAMGKCSVYIRTFATGDPCAEL